MGYEVRIFCKKEVIGSIDDGFFYDLAIIPMDVTKGMLLPDDLQELMGKLSDDYFANAYESVDIADYLHNQREGLVFLRLLRPMVDEWIDTFPKDAELKRDLNNFYQAIENYVATLPYDEKNPKHYVEITCKERLILKISAHIFPYFYNRMVSIIKDKGYIIEHYEWLIEDKSRALNPSLTLLFWQMLHRFHSKPTDIAEYIKTKDDVLFFASVVKEATELERAHSKYPEDVLAALTEFHKAIVAYADQLP